GRQPQHCCGNRAAFIFVAREECFRGTAKHRSELPAEIVGILHTGIEPLPAGRWMNVSGIACEEHATYAKAIRQTCMHVVGGNPCYGTDQDVVSAGASRNHGGQPLSREIDITLQGDDGLQLEKVGSSERTQRYLTWGSVVEPVPCIPTQPFHGNVCNDRSY